MHSKTTNVFAETMICKQFSNFRSEKRDKIAVFSVSLVLSTSSSFALNRKSSSLVSNRSYFSSAPTYCTNDAPKRRNFQAKNRVDRRRNVVCKKTLRHLHKQSTKSTIQHKSSTGIIIINIVVIYRICSQIPI